MEYRPYWIEYRVPVTEHILLLIEYSAHWTHYMALLVPKQVCDAISVGGFSEGFILGFFFESRISRVGLL